MSREKLISTKGPREKMIERGVECLTDRELVSVLIGFGSRKHDYRKLSGMVVKRLRNASECGMKIGVNELVELDGVGVAKASAIFAGLELGRRMYYPSSDGQVIDNSQAAYECVAHIAKQRQERLVAVYLNARYEKIATRIIAIGSANRLFVQPRDVIAPALELNAISILIAHNHPSGSIEPSDEDKAVTRRIREGCEIVGVKLLDHLIVGDGGWASIL